MSQRPLDYRTETRDTIVKSGLTGVAASMLAAAIFSPAGMGGMIGTSIASGLGLNRDNADAADLYARLPAYPAPVTQIELDDINVRLAQTMISLEIAHAATDARIEYIRSIAIDETALSFTPVAHVAPPGAGMSFEPAAPVELLAPVPAAELTALRDTHLEFAELLLAYDRF